MRRFCFKIFLKSDIVLQKYSNTEGQNEHLDFISGSALRGLIAREYEKFGDSFDIFHSSKVRFGAAKPLIENKITHKIPLCFFHPKNENSQIYNALFCDFNEKDLQDLQLKQIRADYFSDDKKRLAVEANYAQKINLHADNKEKKQMFGYEALKKGSTWGFELLIDESVSEHDLAKILELLKGKNFIGKSKNAEFGEIFIEKCDFGEENCREINGALDYLYVDSPLALFDGANPTICPTRENLNLNENCEICWEKTQLRTHNFTPYNAKRAERDSARLVIESGSVIAVKNLSVGDKARLKNGVGGFLSEGFGKILINPKFLFWGEDKKAFEFQKLESHADLKESNSAKLDKILIKFLQSLKNSYSISQDRVDKANKFIAENAAFVGKIAPSQWGAIRAFVQFDDSKFREAIEKYISKGVASSQWEDLRKKMLEFVEANDKTTIALLAIFAQKSAKKDEE